MIEQLQTALREYGLDGWLFFDHHYRDPLSYRILGLDSETHVSRRWYYFVPEEGMPWKLVHRIEPHVLDALEGSKLLYSGWAEQHRQLAHQLAGSKRIAMQYSPRCEIPYISNVDAGTIELLRDIGLQILSSANLVQEFEARWTQEQLQSHLAAGRLVDAIRCDAFKRVGAHLQSGMAVSEYEIQQYIRVRMHDAGLITDHGPIVAADKNASDPHYEPTQSRSSRIKTDDVLLIDLWAKLRQSNSVYYDVTWTGFCGRSIPSDVQNVFEAVRDARKLATELVASRLSRREDLRGFEVDDATRGFLRTKGLAEHFIHRTGHSIGTEVHGNGANMDNLESHDDRRIIPNTCFSVEPGVYLSNFGIRSEVNVYVESDRAWVTGEQQESLVRVEC